MIENLAVFTLSFTWLMLASLQSRLLNHKSRRLSLVLVSFVASAVWVSLVRKVVIGDSYEIIFAYSLGSSFGVLTAKELHIKMGGDA